MKPPIKTFELRMPPDLHETIRATAFMEKTSINKWIVRALERAVEPDLVKRE